MSTTHFGFKEVNTSDKSNLVKGVFDSVASQYDLMNDLMSGGLHRLWKDAMVSHLRAFDGVKLLDLAGGTGDISFRFWEKAKAYNPDITISDINASMLEEGRSRAVDRNMLSLNWQIIDAESIPHPDNHFDYVTIAFGIRNVTHIDQALKEAHRVLKPGGKFVCLEFSHVQHDVLRRLYDYYSFTVLPQIGHLVTKDKASYQYLAESIRQFPDAPKFAAMIEQAGFTQAHYDCLSGGIVAIHWGWKI